MSCYEQQLRMLFHLSFRSSEGENLTSSGMLIVTPFGNVFQPMQVRELSRTLQRLGTFT